MSASPFAARFRRDLPPAAAALIPDTGLMCRASTGTRGWAAVPWLAAFDPRLTRSMRRGVYVAVFVVSGRASVVLALQHGAEDLLDRLGPARGRDALRARAARLRAATGPVAGMAPGPSDLGATAPLPRGYEAGTIWHREWTADAIGPGTVSRPFARLARDYAAWARAGMFDTP